MITLNENSEYLQAPYTPIPLPLIGDTEYTEVIKCPWCRDLFVQVLLTGLASGESVDVTVEGSLDNSGWDNLAATGLATNIDTDGTTLLKFPDKLPPYVRVRVETTLVTDTVAAYSIQAHIAAVA